MKLRQAAAVVLSLASLGACGGDSLPAGLSGTLVFVSDRGGRDAIYLRRLPDGADFLLVAQPEPVGRPALSPNGREVAFTTQGRVGIVTVDTREVRFLTHAVDWKDESPSWRPDGKALVVSARPAEGAPADLHQLPLSVPAGGEVRRHLTRTPQDEREPVFSPDGSFVVYVREDRVFRLDLAGGQAQPLTRGFKSMHFPRFLPDGRLVALWTQDKQFGIEIMDAGGTTHETIAQGSAFYRTVAPSPDGKYLAATLAFRTDVLRLRQNEQVVLLDLRGQPLGTLARSWRSATHSPHWGR